jgi:MFS family permease
MIFIIYILNFMFAVSTTIGMTLIPLLATDKLGISLFLLGIIEGATEFLSNVLRLVTGNLFDRVKNRKLLFVGPATLAFISKVLLYFPTGLSIFIAKIVERTANGAFAAPRDAFVGENATNKGMALSFLSMSKTLGCVFGPFIVSLSTLILGPLQENMTTVIALACIINFVAFVASFLIKSKKETKTSTSKQFDLQQLKLVFQPLSPLFVLTLLFFMGRFNDGLIMIYLKKQGFPEWFYLSTISFFNLSMLIISPLMGYIIDRGKYNQALLITIVGLLSFNIFFSTIAYMSWFFACLGLIAWGIQRVGAQVTFAALIFKEVPVNFYGTAIGAYSVISGVGTLIASLLCGYYAQQSFQFVFMLSGFFSICSLALAYYKFK